MTESGSTQETLRQCLSEDAKKKITAILNDIKILSDVEKLFLYLQLPTGSSVEVNLLKQKVQSNPLGKKGVEDGTFAVTWIQSHLEEDSDVSLPKQEVYDEYQSYCEVTGNEVLCAADFGKVMKQIFPSVKPRRLGTRGNSRYCYSGLRKKVKIYGPSLPDLQYQKELCKTSHQESDEIALAACHVLFEWAEKLLGSRFTSVTDLAYHLIENVYVDNRSVAAFRILLSSSSEKVDKGCLQWETKSKRSETHLHLQRKLQEKELFKEQKRKLDEQQAYLLKTNNGKPVYSKKRSIKIRKAHLHSTNGRILTKDKEYGTVSHCESELRESVLSADENSGRKVCNVETQASSNVNSDTQQLTEILNESTNIPSVSELSQPSPPTVLVLKDYTKMKPKNKILRINKNSVCVTQNIPSFIIVPSQVQLKDAEFKTCNKAQHKYKRIQPKPLNEVLTSTMRCRTRSLGSSALKELKPSYSNGRRSSLAMLQSSAKHEFRNMSAVSLNQKHDGRQLSVNCKKILQSSYSNEIAAESSQYRLSSPSSNEDKELCVDFDDINTDSKSKLIETKLSPKRNTEEKKETVTLADDVIRGKRHSEEIFEVVNKKPHLVEFLSSDISNESLSPWAKDIADFNCGIDTNFLIQNSTEISSDCKKEEVSIRELESDALIDYLEDASIAGNVLPESRKLSDDEVRKHDLNPEVKELSQLRMLLEQNLPHTVTKTVRTPNDGISSKKASVLMHTNEFVPAHIVSECKEKREILLENCSEPSIFLRNIKPCLSGESNTERTFDKSDHELLTEVSKSFPFNSNLSNFRVDSSGRQIFSADTFPSNIHQLGNVEFSSMPAQVPSVPPSPNTRRRAFNFMPISPRHTPIPEGSSTSSVHTCYSPVPIQLQRNTLCVGPQSPSNSGSPFVSPRSTPIPPSRSRHSSGQSTYSTSRHTPFQNLDSGISSISTSPFISPQPTPIPVSRLRHNSSHGSCKTVTFSSVSNSQMHIPNFSGPGLSRLRHSSGPGGPHMGSLLSPKTAPLSQLVSENAHTNFNFHTMGETYSRHNSGLTVTTLSPVSEQASVSGNSNILPEICSAFDSPLSSVDPFISHNSGSEMISTNNKRGRQRHVSSSVIHTKSSSDPLAQEIQLLLKDRTESITTIDSNNRCHSAPLHQMLQSLVDNSTNLQYIEEDLKSYTSTITSKQNVSFPMLVSNSTLSIIPVASDSLNAQCDKSLQSMQNEWTLDCSSDMAISSLRRNSDELLQAQLGDELQTTLDDLKDCDTDFSKFAQQFDEQCSQNNDSTFSFMR